MYSAADSMGPYVPWAAGGLDGEPPNSHNDLEHLWLPLPKRIYIPKFGACFPYLSSHLLEGGTYNTPQITSFNLFLRYMAISLGFPWADLPVASLSLSQFVRCNPRGMPTRRLCLRSAKPSARNLGNPKQRCLEVMGVFLHDLPVLQQHVTGLRGPIL